MDEIAALLHNTRFKKQIFGGIRPSDMWQKLERLHMEYAEVLAETQIRHEALLEERDEEIQQLRQQLKQKEYFPRSKDIQGDSHG